MPYMRLGKGRPDVAANPTEEFLTRGCFVPGLYADLASAPVLQIHAWGVTRYDVLLCLPDAACLLARHEPEPRPQLTLEQCIDNQ